MLLHQGHVAQQGGGGAVGSDMAAIEDDRARAQLLNEVHIVRGDQQGLRQAGQQVDEAAARARVQAGRGLI